MLRRAPKPTPTDTLSPYTTLFRSTLPTRARDVRTFTESGARQRCTIRRTRAHRTHSYGPDGLVLLVHLDSDAHQYTRSPGHGGMGSAGHDARRDTGAIPRAPAKASPGPLQHDHSVVVERTHLGAVLAHHDFTLQLPGGRHVPFLPGPTQSSEDRRCG